MQLVSFFSGFSIDFVIKGLSKKKKSAMSPYIRALTQVYVANAQSTLAIRSVFPNNLF